jgi:hypothetical protein
MLDKALHLCSAAFGYMLSCEGEVFHRVASRGFSPALAAALPPPGPTPGSLAERFVRGEKIICAANLIEEGAYRLGAPAARALVDVGGVRSYVAVALRNGDRLVGVIAIYRQEVRPFSDKQIALLQNFAEQAVIAMENARLIIETREALEQQTATAEILRVISGSPTDVQPTFDAIAANATTLSGAAAGMVFRFDGSLIHFVSSHGLPPDLLQAMQRSFPSPPDRRSTTTRAIQRRKVVHVPMSPRIPNLHCRPSLKRDGTPPSPCRSCKMAIRSGRSLWCAVRWHRFRRCRSLSSRPSPTRP